MDAPAHVPRQIVFDFDFFKPGPENDQDPFLCLLALNKRPRIFWTPRHGGHWVFTRAADFRGVLEDPETFSSRMAVFRGDGQPLGGRFIPVEVDPPLHGAYRKPLDPFFSSGNLEYWLKNARKLAVEMIEKIRKEGRCEFIGDFGRIFPASVLLRMCDLPIEDADRLTQWCMDGMRLPDAWGDAPVNLAHYFNSLVITRFLRPGQDAVTRIITADMGAGRCLNETEAIGMMSQLLGGGVNMMLACMGWVTLFLARNPSHRAQLVADPSLIPNAVNELLRRFSAPNLWRVVRKNVKFQGTELKMGDRVLLPTAIYGMDESVFKNPTEVDFRRTNAGEHLAFGSGPHQCPGRNLALQLTLIYLEEWLKRIRDFEIPPDVQPRVETLSWIVVTSLPLRWQLAPQSRGKRGRVTPGA